MSEAQISLLSYSLLAATLGVCFCVALAELRWPARRNDSEDERILVNILLGAVALSLPFLLSISSIVAAQFSARHGWGLFISYPGTSVAIIVLLHLLARTLVDYGIHRLFHRWPLLWTLHGVHHSDQSIDLSTGLRAHPLGVLLQVIANMALVVAMGSPILVVMMVDALLFLFAIVQHANVRLPSRLAGRLEWVVVTPRLHMIHHARDRALHDSNYGEIFTFWDRLFGTYRAPIAEEFAIGVRRETA